MTIKFKQNLNTHKLAKLAQPLMNQTPWRVKTWGASLNTVIEELNHASISQFKKVVCGKHSVNGEGTQIDF